MSPISHAFQEHSLIGTCLKLAQSTFQQSMPAAVLPDAALAAAPAVPRASLFRRIVEAFDDWSYRQQVREREAYLGQAQDIFDLENRLRQIDRRGYF